jgi:hypothetical protein
MVRPPDKGEFLGMLLFFVFVFFVMVFMWPFLCSFLVPFYKAQWTALLGSTSPSLTIIQNPHAHYFNPHAHSVIHMHIL